MLSDEIEKRLDAVEKALEVIAQQLKAMAGPETALTVIQNGQVPELFSEPVVSVLSKKPKTPTKAYIDHWLECRRRSDMGPEVKLGQHAEAFVELHSQAMQNFTWGCAAIVEFYLDDFAADKGCPIRLFKFGVADYLQRAKRRWSKIEQVRSAPVGLPAEDSCSPEESKAMLAKIMAQLRGKK